MLFDVLEGSSSELKGFVVLRGNKLNNDVSGFYKTDKERMDRRRASKSKTFLHQRVSQQRMYSNSFPVEKEGTALGVAFCTLFRGVFRTARWCVNIGNGCFRLEFKHFYRGWYIQIRQMNGFAHIPSF